jgi:hypothetical protein
VYFRLRVFEVRNEVLALGALAYALPRSRATAIAMRVAAALAVVGIAAEIGEWMLDFTPRVPAVGGVGGALGHLSELVAFGGVVAMWFVVELLRRDGGVVDEGA